MNDYVIKGIDNQAPIVTGCTCTWRVAEYVPKVRVRLERTVVDEDCPMHRSPRDTETGP
jgi:hypothetical protein